MSSKAVRIDAHQHFWLVQRGDYGWLTPELEALYRDFLPKDLEPILDGAAIEGSVLVQAAPTVAETHYMLSLADENAFIKGVVGWVDFEAQDAAEQIAALASHSRLVGLRPMIQNIEADDWMLQPSLASAFEALIAHDLTFDALTLPRHLPYLQELLARYPDLCVVIDHGSKPDIANGAFDDWARDMALVAEQSQAYCKLSGLVTEAGEGWTAEMLQPYVDHLLATFGPSRLIWGSDWPVCLLASSYARWLAASDWLLKACSDEDRMAIFGGNAVRAYRLCL
ncbi:MAG: amidohydrolase family protein [Cohaesibacter sp.]|nr:amidohydrolase family protein [Cohaesibacter sp.]